MERLPSTGDGNHAKKGNKRKKKNKKRKDLNPDDSKFICKHERMNSPYHACVQKLSLNVTGGPATTTAAAATASAAVTTTASSSPILRVAILVAALALPGSLRLLCRLLRLLCLLGRVVSWKIRDGSRDRFGVLVNVEALVDTCGDGLDFGAQIALNVVEVEAIVPVD